MTNRPYGSQLLLCLFCASLLGCERESSNRLDTLPQTDVRIKDHTFRVWIADEEEERLNGLMHVSADEMSPLADGTERGMVFVFPSIQGKYHGFYMKNTIIPLDIAYIRTDGTIVNIQTMAPLDTRTYIPGKPYRYALEVRGNLLSEIGIATGDKAEIPESLLKDAR